MRKRRCSMASWARRRRSAPPWTCSAACGSLIAEHIGSRYPHQVSGGQLQRAMTAMAMACRPDLIIFDEPTTALDVTTQIEVLAAIKDIVRQFNTAAIYITHDLAVVAQMADRVMVLRYGELVEEAPTGAMLANPQQAYTKSLWAVRSLRKEEEPGEDALLRVRGVDAGYSAAVKVLQDISVEVSRGRTVAVVGESGSGKSTLARVITGLLPPLKGQVVFDGKPLPPALKGRSKDMLRRLQMIYQSPIRPSIRAGACATSWAGRCSSIAASPARPASGGSSSCWS